MIQRFQEWVHGNFEAREGAAIMLLALLAVLAMATVVFVGVNWLFT